MMKRFVGIVSISAGLMVFPVKGMTEYVFTAPPRETADKGIEIYKPVADFLTKKTGEKFVYRYPADWAEYGKGMQNGDYDMAFDGPHFVSWRLRYVKHDAIVKLPQLHIWRIIAKSDNARVNVLDDLIGKKFCAPKSPNFGMLTAMSHFSNPERQPVHVITKGWKDSFDALLQDKCEAAVLPMTNHEKFDPGAVKTKDVHTHLPYPNQAFTVGPRLTPALKAEVQSLLLSAEGQQATSKIRDRFAGGEELVSAENEEYEGISLVLKRAGNFLSVGND